MPKKVILAGGTGFLGQALARRLRARGCDVVVLTRAAPRPRGDGVREVPWPAQPVAGMSNPIGYTRPGWAAELDGADAVVNLAGRSINGAPTAENRRAIRASRVDAVRALGAALRACRQPPAVWVQCSAVGYYGHRADGFCAETAPAGDDFLAGVCAEWERVFAAECPAAVRPVVLRLGVVLGREAGAFPPLARAARWFLGGAAGAGRQGLSWIHLTDAEEIFLRAVGDAAMRGTYNACAPEPVTNAVFMDALRRALRRPWSPPVPAPLLRAAARWILRTDPDLILRGQFVRPVRLGAEGFRFQHGRLAGALADLVDRA